MERISTLLDHLDRSLTGGVWKNNILGTNRCCIDRQAGRSAADVLTPSIITWGVHDTSLPLQTRLALCQEYSQPSLRMSSNNNEYWLPNTDINRKVIVSEIQFYLGPNSHARPYTRAVSIQSLIANDQANDMKGEDGFLISTPGPCLTDVSLPYTSSHCDLQLPRQSLISVPGTN